MRLSGDSVMKKKTSVWKMTWRTIRSFVGRYIALLLIVLLGVGFFSGLKITRNAMADTADRYLGQQAFYDFYLLSTLGFSGDAADEFTALNCVEGAEGSKQVDAMMAYEESEKAYKLIALPDELNLPSLTAGRMPENNAECLADTRKFDEDAIGRTIMLSEDNSDDALSAVKEREYTIVGLAESPLYLNNDRGTTGIGSGALEGFLYLPQDDFVNDYYSCMYVTLREKEEIYSDAYDDLVAACEDEVAEAAESAAQARYEEILKEQREVYGGAGELTEEQFEALAGVEDPEVYVLTRDENNGYVSFENDTSIVSGIADIFPVFFILIAMLVCITTMSRMVDEERTQIGVLKALGYSNGRIMAKYLLYAGSATVIGWAVGFFTGTWGLPQVFWLAYSALYGFADMRFSFYPGLAAVTLLVALAGILGSTWGACCRELFSEPAKLIRPRTAKAGKRILLERVTPLWSRLSFLRKITIRNMFRYKKRLLMMLVGIGCCTALMVTGFGVRDSMIGIGSLQFEQIQTYDCEAAFPGENTDAVRDMLEDTGEVGDYLLCSKTKVDISGNEKMNSVYLYSFAGLGDAGEREELDKFWSFQSDGRRLDFPEDGEALISRRMSEKLSLQKGDTLQVQDSDMQTLTVVVSGVFDNYFYNYVIVSDRTQETAFGSWQANTALVRATGDSDRLAEILTGEDTVTSVIQLSAWRDTIEQAMSCLDYIIGIVVLFAGALAFIVTFNLTNINLAERSREIATVEVLGFYPKETESYVLRENLVLSVIAAFLGLPLGKLCHRVVMGKILLDIMTYPLRITAASYVMAVVCTIAFALLVNLFMRRQITKIPMAESLKAVE
jgi:putative ABC transport system permease protein